MYTDGPGEVRFIRLHQMPAVHFIPVWYHIPVWRHIPAAHNIAMLLFIFLILCSSADYSQVPPHPRLEQKISRGQIHLPKQAFSLPDSITPSPDSIGLNFRRTSNAARRTSNAALNFLVVLVDFQDKVHSAPAEYFDSTLFSSSSPYSLKSYFSQISGGRMNFNTLDLPSKRGWIRAAQNYAFYTSGGNYGMGAYPNNTEKLVEDIAMELDPFLDFSKYDNDKDGYVDGLIIVHSGCGAEYSGSTNDIWSHNWLINSFVSDDGVYVQKYVVCPEYYFSSKDYSTIGVFAHEFCHSYFGLSDLYDPDGSSKGLGKWSLMSNGCWNGNSLSGGDMPAFPDAYSRIQMGFENVQAMAANVNDLEIKPTETDSNQIYKIWGNGKYSGSEYFLIENREKTGFDRDLPGEGLIIYHIDENARSNSTEWYPGHTASGHYRVALEQADNSWDLERNINYGDDGDPFPGSSQNSSGLSLLSSPDSRSYQGKDSKVSIKNIRRSGKNILADINLTLGYQGGLSVTNPLPRERVSPGADYSIRWTSSNISKVTIQYSYNGGTSWTTLASNIDCSKGWFLWHVPKTYRAFCKIRLLDEVYPSYYAESGLFSVTNQTGPGKYAQPGDLVFTQMLSGGVSEAFELLALKDVDITDLKIMNVPLTDNAAFSSDKVFLDMNTRDMGYFTVAPKGTFIRFVKDKTSGYDIDSTGTILTIYFPLPYGYPPVAPILNMKTSPLVVFRGNVQKPLFIAGFDLANSAVALNSVFFRPNTFKDILPPGVLANYWFRETVSGRDNFIKNAIRMPDNWAASNSELYLIRKTITFSELDVDLMDLKGSYFNNSVEIKWLVQSETNNQGWQVQRRTLNTEWINLGFTASSGDFNNTSGRAYTFTDASITTPETYYYRLRQISLNNTSNYSHDIKVAAVYPSSYKLDQNYPNPFNASTSVKFALPAPSDVKLTVYNSIGQTVQEHNLGIMSAGVNKIDLNLNRLPSGAYFYTLRAGSVADQNTFTQTRKMLMIK